MRFSDVDLDFGYVLFMEDGHELSVSEIKKKTKAKTVKRIKTPPKSRNGPYTPSSYLYDVIRNGFAVLGQKPKDDFRLLTVTGNPQSTWLNLNYGRHVVGLHLTPDEIRLCAWASDVIIGIMDVRHALSLASSFHDETLDLLESEEYVTGSLAQESGRFLDNYGENEITQLQAIVRRHFNSRW